MDKGKTTLAKILAGEIKDYSGEWNLGHNVNIGYFAQNQEEVLTPDKTVLQEAEDAFATRRNQTKSKRFAGSFLLLAKRCKKKDKVLWREKETVWRFVNCYLSVQYFNYGRTYQSPDIQSKEIIKIALQNLKER